MGVPKFFRYISERYPCLSELAREEKIPEFDNLYLDMNGIIHNCSHPDDGNVHFRITEEDMFRDIFNYIDRLFFLIKPKELFFLAVDGVAPRAKMNQQRSRRFRSAKEAETLEKNAIKRGEVLPNEARFDSNCITPGTEFMVRLQNALKYFIKQKISSNTLWQKCRVILSGHETPGEGEHKIMEYIRYLKSKKGYDPYTRHCLYGLDADLIILGLCTHELHFSLLREEVLFGKKAKRTSAEETRFFLLHLNLLREYLELEFRELQNERDFDLDKLIDDWILMGFLVGNDFIPHLPNMHIHANALPKLYKAYTSVWPQLGGYINENGELKLERLEKFFQVLGEYDVEFFEVCNSDLKYLESKKLFKDEREAFDFDATEVHNMDMDEELDNLIKATNDFMNDDETDYDDDIPEKEFTSYKRDYYINKLKYKEMTQDVLDEQTECYITALQWILYYYYKGVQSWGWFYPHHYAPFVSDLKDFKHLSIKFDIGKPFLPFQQLLAVLPAASKELLPAAFSDLMTNPNSSLIKYYPTEFETDLNGKKQDWEAVVLIPFIDEAYLLLAMETCLNNLTPDERRRNIHGPMFQYDYTSISQGECRGIYTFKTIANVLCTETEIWRDEISVSKLSGNFRRPVNNVFYPGFPTMKHLKYTAELRNERVKVFEQPSRNDNMILMPDNKEINNLEDASKQYLNKEVHIGWPHLTQAKIVAISTKDKKVEKSGEFIMNNQSMFNINYKTIVEHHMGRMGIDFKNISIIVHARVLSGTEYHCSPCGKLNLVNVWESTPVPYPIQGVVKELSTSIQDTNRSIKIEDYFPIGARIYMLSHPYFGSEGKVLDPMMVYNCGRLKVSITVLPEPDFSDAKLIQSDLEAQYLNPYEAATAIGIEPNCLLRATGSILIIPGAKRLDVADNSSKIQIGLHLRYPKNNEELAGYTRKAGNTWLFSLKALKLVEEYLQRYPQIFKLLYKGYSNATFFESDLFPEQIGENRLSDITSWIKEQDHVKAERIPCGTKSVEKATLQSVIASIEKLKELPVKNVKLQVKPHLIVKPNTKTPSFCRKKKLNLFDRVVLTKDLHQIAAGHKGTIISLHPVLDLNPVRIECVKAVETFYEILSDKELPGGSEMHGLAKGRIFKVSEYSVLQISDEETKSYQEQYKDKLLDLSNEIKNNKDMSSVENKSFQPVEKRFACTKNGEQKYISNGDVQSANKNNREIKLSNSDNIKEEPFIASKGSEILKPFKGIKIASSNYLTRYSPPVREETSKVIHTNQLSESVNNHRQNTAPKQISSKIKSPKTNVKDNKEESHKNITKVKMSTINNRNLNGETEILQPTRMGSSKTPDGTEALKKLLGIDGNVDKETQRTYILKNDLSNIKPPQPPPSWRIEPKKTSDKMPSLQNTTSNKSISIASSFIPEGAVVPILQMSQPQKKIQIHKQHHQLPQDSPATSYHCTWPEVSVPGAFIPLQALTGRRRQHKDNHDQSIKQEERRSKAGETKDRGLVPKISANPKADPSKHKRNGPLKVRTPRIAAKFDYTQQ